ncbi:MAG: sugar phosphate isomerase/epimerase [Gemmatimonadota bacterium]
MSDSTGDGLNEAWGERLTDRSRGIARRDALRLLAVAAAGTLLPRLAGAGSASTAVASRRIERVGLRLHTVRAALRADIPGTLAAVADAGVHEVEFSEYLNKPAPWWRALLREHGLTAPAAHAVMPATDAGWAPLFAHARTMQHNWIVVPGTATRARNVAERWKRLAARLNQAAKLGARAGINVAYHNGEIDFSGLGSTSGYEILMAETDPSLVDFELDIFSAMRAGQDPLVMLDRWRGRFTSCHLRDMGPAPARRAMDVGAGTIDFASILEKGRPAGLRHWFIDTADAADPIASVRASALAMTGL